MKLRTSITVACFLLIHLASNAQNYHLGLRLGYNQSDLLSDDESAFALKDRQSFSFGFIHSFRPYQSDFGLSVETGYVLKGVRIESESLDYRLHYINAPILFDYYPTERLKLSAGPEIAYLADARNRLTDSTSVGIDDVYDKQWDISGTMSVSYAVDFFMDIGARYNRSFTKFNQMDAVLNRKDQYVSYFQVFLAFKIAN